MYVWSCNIILHSYISTEVWLALEPIQYELTLDKRDTQLVCKVDMFCNCPRPIRLFHRLTKTFKGKGK